MGGGCIIIASLLIFSTDITTVTYVAIKVIAGVN